MNHELFSLYTEVVRHFLKDDATVATHSFIAAEDDKIDMIATAKFFADVQLSGALGDAFMYACRASPAPGASPHPALFSIGGSKFYGAADRDWDSGSTLIGPIWFGSKVKMRVSSKIIGPSLIDDEAFVNTTAIITRSIVGPRCQIEEGVTLKDAVIGGNVFIGAGARLTSHCEDDPRHEREVEVSWRPMAGYPAIKTGRKKMGPIVGDGCSIGANAVLKPGVILFPNCVVGAGRVLPAGIYPNTEAIWATLNPPPRHVPEPRY